MQERCWRCLSGCLYQPWPVGFVVFGGSINMCMILLPDIDRKNFFSMKADTT
jgi:hypothetical protein